MTSWGGVHFDGEARSLVKHQRQKFSNIFTRNQFVGSSLFTSNRKEQGYSVLRKRDVSTVIDFSTVR